MNTDHYKAFCKLCCTTLRAHKNAIRKHSKTPDHIERAKLVGLVQPVTNFVKSNPGDQQKTSELKLAVHIIEHGSFRSIDHLGELLSKNHPESPALANLRLHRTKCSRLLTQVLSPCLHKELTKDILDSKSSFSLVIDESTDVSCLKCLALMIRYYSNKFEDIVSTFYCLVNIEKGDAETQVDAILHQLNVDDLPIEKLLGVGVDGAAVNIGAHHSIATLLKERNPHIVIFKCICHSLHLAASKATEVLPRHLDFIVRETCSWFTCSSKRQNDYQALYATLCDGEKAKKIGRFAETRWLSRSEVVKKILDQWDALTLHFQVSRNSERCFTAEQLYSMFSNPINKAYLTFLNQELESICKLNKYFQSDNLDVTKLYQDLADYYLSLLQRIIHPKAFKSISKSNLASFDITTNLIPPSALHLGFLTHEILDQSYITKESQDVVKEACFSFLKELASQIKQRLPENLSILKDLEMLSPQNATSQRKSSIAPLASKFPNLAPDIDQVEREWNLLHQRSWTCVSDTTQFWVEVYNTLDAEGQKKFFHVSFLALSLISLPYANAIVERAFSQMGIVKTKLRNRLAVETVNAVLQTRYS